MPFEYVSMLFPEILEYYTKTLRILVVDAFLHVCFYDIVSTVRVLQLFQMWNIFAGIVIVICFRCEISLLDASADCPVVAEFSLKTLGNKNIHVRG